MTSNKPLTLSIIIPAYNEEAYIGACLEAIAKQTVKPDEVIVVDNNSSDKTAEIAQSYSFAKVIHEKSRGIVFARDRGFDAASSDIIGRIDADTVLSAGWVERVKQFYSLPSFENHALTGGCTFYNVRLPRLHRWITNQFVFRMNRMLTGHYILWGSNMAFPAKLWQAVRDQCCRRTDIHEDLDLAIHLHRSGYHISYQAGLLAGARMGHVFEDHKALWPNMLWWPRTLRIHGMKTWVIGWAGAVILYVGQILPRSMEFIAVLLGFKPLNRSKDE